MAEFTCKAIALAALATGPKNILTRIVLIWLIPVPAKELNNIQLEKDSKFLSKLDETIEYANTILPQINNVFASYTVHGVRHSINVMEYMYALVVDINKLSELMSKNPANILRMNKGTISVGKDGDLVLVDLNKEITIDKEAFASKGKNTPFQGRKYFGEIVKTIKGGKVIYSK